MARMARMAHKFKDALMARTAHKFKDTPKPGTIFTLEDGTKVKVVPNLIQIINQKSSCVGCFFDNWERGECELLRTNSVPTNKCANHNIDPKYQVIYVREE